MADLGGRPPEHDRIALGKEFVEWAKTNPRALTVPMFCVQKGLHSGLFRKWVIEDPDGFGALFYQGKELIGINRLNMTLSDSEVKLDGGIYRQTMAHYDTDIKAELREEKKYESSLRKDEEGSKQSTYTIVVSDDLAAGTDLSTPSISNKHNQSPK